MLVLWSCVSTSWTYSFLALRSNFTLIGQPNQDPTKVEVAAESYLGENCVQEMMTMVETCNITVANSVTKTYNVGIMSAKVRLAEAVIASYNCTNPPPAGQWVDIM